MKATPIMWDNKTYGIRVYAENGRECSVIRRLWESGAKLNATNLDRDWIDVTFADLIDDIPIVVCDGD